MVRGNAGCFGTFLSWVGARLKQRSTAAASRGSRWTGVLLNAVLLCAGLSVAPAFAQMVSSTVSPTSFSNAGDVLTFTFNVNSNSSPITGVSFSGVPTPLQGGSCAALTATGTCTATYTTTADDVLLGGVQVSLGFTMARATGGSWSGQVSSTPAWISKAGVPSAPSGLSAVAGPRSATVSFNPSAENGGGPVTYAITAMPLNGGVPKSVQGSSSPLVVTGLTGGRSYQFYSNAFNAAGGSLQGGPSNTIVALVAPPVVTSLNKTSGPTTGATVVQLTGNYFEDATAVRFGATAATSFTVINNNLISAVAPAGAAGVVNITVQTSDGPSSPAVSNQYTYVPPPTVTSVSPTAGPASGGSTVIITGTNLSDATAVTFGGTAATSYTIINANQIMATAPAGTGTVDIRVTTLGGTSAASAADQFTYRPPPTVTSISPTAGPTGGGTTVVITGTNLSDATAVTFGGTASGFTTNSSTQITTATSPAGLPGTVDVTVTTIGGTSATSAADQFTYVAAPTVTAIAPPAGPSTGGTTVVITGTGFSGATAVTFGGLSAGYITNSNTQITATAPAGIPGTVDIRVTTVGGTSATSVADQYTYVEAPAVAMISPAAGPTSGGTTVTISGLGFSGATAVSFGATAATGYTVNSNNQITATAPAGVGTVDVQVSTVGGTSTPAAASKYTFVAPPVASSFTFGSLIAYNAGADAASLVDVSGHASNAPTSYAVGSATTAQGGSVSINSAGVATYTPPRGHRGNDSFIFTATNIGGTSAPATVTVTIGNPVLTAVAPANDGTVGIAYNPTAIAVQISGGRAAYSGFSASGLPNGLSMDAAGIITGTPTVAGNFTVTVTATDSSLGTGPYTGTAAFSLSIAAPVITLTPAVLSDATGGSNYNEVFTASGGIAPHTFSLSGTLPDGVALSGSGVLSGTPTESGSFPINVTAEDAGGYTGTTGYTLVVNAPTISLLPANLPTFQVGVPFGQGLSASGGTGPYSFTVSGNLPAGLDLVGHQVTGTPAVAGSTPITLTATDALGFTGSQSYTLVVDAGVQSITFGAQSSVEFVADGDVALSPVAFASSGLPVSYSSQTSAVCSVSGSTVTMLSAGNCVIAADQAGDGNWTAAPQVTQAISITPATQVITGFAANPSAPVFTPGGNFTVSASGGASGAPVVFASASPTVCNSEHVVRRHLCLDRQPGRRCQLRRGDPGQPGCGYRCRYTEHQFRCAGGCGLRARRQRRYQPAGDCQQRACSQL